MLSRASLKKIYHTIWGTGAYSTVERLLDTTSCAKSKTACAVDYKLSNNTYSFYFTGLACRQKHAVPLCMPAPHGVQNRNSKCKSAAYSTYAVGHPYNHHSYGDGTPWYSPQVSCGLYENMIIIFLKEKLAYKAV